MGRKQSNWHVPSDWAFLFGWMLVVPTAAILSSSVLPALSQIKDAKAVDLFYSGIAFGCLGIILLFFARLPLYRQRRFWSFGPGALPAFHRKLYWLAYAAVVAAVLLLGVVWLQIR